MPKKAHLGAPKILKFLIFCSGTHHVMPHLMIFVRLLRTRTSGAVLLSRSCQELPYSAIWMYYMLEISSVETISYVLFLLFIVVTFSIDFTQNAPWYNKLGVINIQVLSFIAAFGCRGGLQLKAVINCFLKTKT